MSAYGQQKPYIKIIIVALFSIAHTGKQPRVPRVVNVLYVIDSFNGKVQMYGKE